MNELALFNRLFDGFDNENYSIHLPKVDVKEEKDVYTLEMDLPGKTDKDVAIELNDNVLTISSEKEVHNKEEDKKDGSKWLMKERSYSKFSRSFTLPKDVDNEKLSASVKNGVLTVLMPRKALIQPKRIQITCA